MSYVIMSSVAKLHVTCSFYFTNMLLGSDCNCKCNISNITNSRYKSAKYFLKHFVSGITSFGCVATLQ